MAKVIDFQIIEEIAPDEEYFNWETRRYEPTVSTTSQKYFAEHLAGLTDADTVNLYINSMGGSVKEAIGIYSLLQRCPATVTAYIDGFAVSAASVIAMAADKIIMPRNTCMMIHNAAWLAYGNPAELRKSADNLEVINKSVINSYIMHAGDKLPEDQLVKLLDAETWLTAAQCVQYGLADEFADQDADLAAAAEQFRAAAKSGSIAYARVPDFLAQQLPAPAANQTQKAQAGAPEKHTCSLGNMLLKSLIKMEDKNHEK